MSVVGMRMGVPNASFSCFCCGAEFSFTIDSGGLCDACNDGDCAACGEDDEDWS
jgi:hypothetical protein